MWTCAFFSAQNNGWTAKWTYFCHSRKVKVKLATKNLMRKLGVRVHCAFSDMLNEHVYWSQEHSLIHRQPVLGPRKCKYWNNNDWVVVKNCAVAKNLWPMLNGLECIDGIGGFVYLVLKFCCYVCLFLFPCKLSSYFTQRLCSVQIDCGSHRFIFV